VLSEHGIKIAPSIYYSPGKDPDHHSGAGGGTPGQLMDLHSADWASLGLASCAGRRRAGLEADRDQVGRLMAMAGAIIRSRTAQAKNDDSESRKSRTDDSAKPLFVRMIHARVISRSFTALIDNS
jgi:hypothetical protein